MSITPEDAPYRPGYIRDAGGLYYKIGGLIEITQEAGGGGGVGGVTDHAALTGLDHDDHPQYIKPSEIIGGSGVTVDLTSSPGSAIISALGGGGGGTDGGTNLGNKFVNVQDYTKGAADSTDGIRAAWQAGGIGATYFYPSQPNGYYVSASLKPFERSCHIGQMNPRYWWGDMNSMPGNNSGLSVIRAAAGFTGPAVIHNNNTTTNGSSNATSSGVYFHNLGVWGNAQDGSVDAFDLGPKSGPERMWMISQCMIAWAKVGISGYHWVLRVKDCAISRNGWGIAPHRGADGNSCSNDSLYKDNYVMFNAHHGLELGGSIESGLVGISGNRFERSGTKTTGTFDPNVNSDPYACGIKLTKATTVRIVDNSTDSNSGPGLDADAVSQGAINNLVVVGNIFKRDGSGDGSATNIPGVRFKQIDIFNAYGNAVGFGDPNDNGTGRSNPQYGVEFDNCNHWEWRGTVQLPSGALIKSNGYKFTGTNYQYAISDPRQAMTGTVAGPDANLPTNAKAGMSYFSTTQHVNRTYDEASSVWVSSGGSSGGGTTGASDITLLTKGEYNAIPTKDPDQLYAVTTPGTGLRESFVGTTKIAEYTATFTGLMNSFEGVPLNTLVTPANSGGVSGNAFSSVNGDVKAQSAADLTVPNTRGAVATCANTAVSYVRWLHADYSAKANFRIIVRRLALPPATQRVFQASSGGVVRWEIRWQVDGKVLLTNGSAGGGAWVASVTGITGINTIYRIEGTVEGLNGYFNVYEADSIIPVATMVDEVGSIDPGVWDVSSFGLMHMSNQNDSLQFTAVGLSPTDKFGPVI